MAAEIDQKQKAKEEKILARENKKNRKVQPEDEDLEKEKEQAFEDVVSDEMKEGGQAQDDTIKLPKDQKDEDVLSNGTEREMENEIRSKDLMHVVEELCAR